MIVGKQDNLYNKISNLINESKENIKRNVNSVMVITYWNIGKIIVEDESAVYRDWETDRKSTRLNSSHITRSRMPSSA